MKVSREQVAANRERIVQAAAALFRERGFEGVAVADVMERAGLTHGAFYGYFPSKDALAAEAAAQALVETTDRWRTLLEHGGRRGLEGVAEGYLSPAHRDHPGKGCAIAALGPEVFRQGTAVRTAFGEVVMRQVETLAAFIPGRPAQKRKKAMAVLAQLVGAIVLARAVDRKALSDEILDAVRDTLGVPHQPPTTRGTTRRSPRH